MRVPLRRLSVLAATAAAWMALIVSAPASAVVTLETYLTNITCGFTTAAGETLPSSCDTLSFDAVLEPGQRAFLRGILTYHYTDDGLPITPMGLIQADINGSSLIAVYYEAAALYFHTNDCSGSRHCGYPPSVVVIGTRFDPAVLGLNDHPDDFWGGQELFVNVANFASAQTPFSIRLFAGWTPVLFSAPVPEPATFALMAVGLVAVSLLARRRRKA